MQKFHYDFMLPKFGKENLDLIFTDTDSLCYHIKNIDPYKVMLKNKDKFDLAQYLKDHELYDPTNDKVLGVFKNELSGKHMTEEAAIRPKTYAYKTDEGKCKKVCKEIKFFVVDQDISFDDYNETRKSGKIKNIKKMGFRSYKHIIFTEETSIKALSSNDDKVFILKDNIHHFNIRP